MSKRAMRVPRNMFEQKFTSSRWIRGVVGHARLTMRCVISWTDVCADQQVLSLGNHQRRCGRITKYVQFNDNEPLLFRRAFRQSPLLFAM